MRQVLLDGVLYTWHDLRGDDMAIYSRGNVNVNLFLGEFDGICILVFENYFSCKSIFKGVFYLTFISIGIRTVTALQIRVTKWATYKFD